MTLSAHTVVGQLLAFDATAQDVLQWYGIRLDARVQRLTLGALCEAYGLDVEEIVADIAATLGVPVSYEAPAPAWRPVVAVA